MRVKKVKPEKTSRTIKHLRKGTTSDIDTLGDAHEYLIGQFAAGAKKSQLLTYQQPAQPREKNIRFLLVISTS
ncbi:MAG: hypothetical protein EBR93_03940 [Bacteroidetes bacterium]|nr:hypothetical protein [Bacteroidota bacterium]